MIRTLRRTAAVLLGVAVIPLSPASGQYVGVYRPPSAWLGFSYSSTRIPGEVGDRIRVEDVHDGSPADHAGLRKGDLIRRVNGLNATPTLVASLAGSLQPGDTVRLQVSRASKTQELRVIAARPPKNFAWAGHENPMVLIDGDSIRSKIRILLDSARIALDSTRIPRLEVLRDSAMVFRVFPGGRDDTLDFRGLRLHLDSLGPLLADSLPRAMQRLKWQVDSLGDVWPGKVWTMQLEMGRRAVAGAELAELNPDLGEYFGVDSGVLVTAVAPGTPSARAGLQAGDVIVRADGETIADIGDLRSAIRDAEDHSVRVEVVRMKRHRTLTLRPD